METSTLQTELKKQSNQLRRNLKTLNYLFILELNSNTEKDSKRLLDIQNLKRSLQREVIRNTRQINLFKTQIENKLIA
ncbi:hypothetical protein H8K90_07195 [Winogradskyella echinorum]|uniref:50S ribosomal protein L29 n=1 Tax=Winogradskyella echinorum TaxID=538189 RepID=A0ABR6Y0A2_9FLAO|nr:hypothetical protein [Winogradskyella echinorum]MBC3846157.1 hypothetical protein [Winogradskyella echinorum]MBC5750505.1 hypothetical protein [Winogradskyella echinorum]